MNTVIKFFKDSYNEIRKVQWPTKDETVRLTGYVIGVSLIVGVFVTGADYLFKELLTIVLG